MNANDENGKVANWDLETASPNARSRRGLGTTEPKQVV
jgi:hypothetical protein